MKSKGLREWFCSGLKMKRWLFLMVIGTIMVCYGISNILIKKEMNPYDMILFSAFFVLGIIFVIISFIMGQKRLLQSVAEYSANPNKKSINLKNLLYDKQVLDKNIKIVAIGDGDGLSNILKGLKIFSNNVTAIVSVIGKNNKELSIDISGVKKAAIALSTNEADMSSFMNYKIHDGEMSGRNSGDVFIEFLNYIHNGNLSEGISHMSKILSINGKIIPSTLNEVEIGAILCDGTRAVGKDELLNKIKEKSSPIEKLFLVPERCEPAEDVIRSIKEADVIIIGPGSFYKGILPILLIREISDAIKKSKANKIFIPNIMTENGFTDNYSICDYIHVLEEHIGKGLFDYCIISDSDIMPEYIRRYNQNGCDLVDINRRELKKMDMNLIIDDFTVVDEKHTIKHDSLKIARAIVKVICDNMDVKDSSSTLEYYTVKTKMDRTKKRKKKNILFTKVRVVTPHKKEKK